MSSFNGSAGHEKKLETAKEKKEQADKAFQVSDLPTGASVVLARPRWGVAHRVLVGRIALRFYHEVNDASKSVSCIWRS